PLAKAQAIAEEMLQRSPDALMASKYVLDAMQHKPRKSLRLEKIWQLKLLLGINSQIARKKDKQPDVQYLPRQYK
ncbi:enoyl-CoA hydratase, partial [bacterium LRH843]|nr:enoyl-CoA hydratase [bacterium LRH843]